VDRQAREHGLAPAHYVRPGSTPPTPTAPGDPPHTHRSSVVRDRLLGAGAGAAAAASLLSSIGNLLLFVTLLEHIYPVELSVAFGLFLFGSVLLVPAFAVAAAALLGDTKLKTARLRSAALCAGAAFAIETAGGVVEAVVYGTNVPEARLVASTACVPTAYLLIAAAALITASAFGSRVLTPPAPDRRRREARLGRASFVLSVGGLLLLVARILILTVYSEFGVTGSVTASEALEVSSWAVVAIAGALAGSAFLKARSRAPTAAGWVAQRDAGLGVATAAFAVAFLLDAIGVMIIAGQLRGKGSTGRWLGGVGELALMVAAGCASVAFVRSRSSSAAPCATRTRSP
jgi:hypothetical protein